MVSNIVIKENTHEIFPMLVQHQMKNIKFLSSSISESGYPRNIPDSSSTQYNPPKDIQVLIRKGDHRGMNSLIRNVSLQQFRQMIGLQSSSNLKTINNRKIRHQSLNNQPQLGGYSKPFSSHETPYQEIRRTGVANTLHIAIEKCYEQLNYIRDCYAETESKIGIQLFNKSFSSMIDMNLSNNSSRVDHLIIEYQYEYNRIIRLHERIQEDFYIQDIESTRQTLDEWFNAIHMVQCRIGDIYLSDENDVFQLTEALRILRITTRKIRTLLWYWLYWSINSPTNKNQSTLLNGYNNKKIDDHVYI